MSNKNSALDRSVLSAKFEIIEQASLLVARFLQNLLSQIIKKFVLNKPCCIYLEDGETCFANENSGNKI